MQDLTPPSCCRLDMFWFLVIDTSFSRSMSKLPVEVAGVVDDDDPNAAITEEIRDYKKTKTELFWLMSKEPHTTNLLFSSQLKKQCCLIHKEKLLICEIKKQRTEQEMVMRSKKLSNPYDLSMCPDHPPSILIVFLFVQIQSVSKPTWCIQHKCRLLQFSQIDSMSRLTIKSLKSNA